MRAARGARVVTAGRLAPRRRVGSVRLLGSAASACHRLPFGQPPAVGMLPAHTAAGLPGGLARPSSRWRADLAVRVSRAWPPRRAPRRTAAERRPRPGRRPLAAAGPSRSPPAAPTVGADRVTPGAGGGLLARRRARGGSRPAAAAAAARRSAARGAHGGARAGGGAARGHARSGRWLPPPVREAGASVRRLDAVGWWREAAAGVARPPRAPHPLRWQCGTWAAHAWGRLAAAKRRGPPRPCLRPTPVTLGGGGGLTTADAGAAATSVAEPPRQQADRRGRARSCACRKGGVLDEDDAAQVPPSRAADRPLPAAVTPRRERAEDAPADRRCRRVAGGTEMHADGPSRDRRDPGIPG
ncbi:hypothetical protein BU14_2655s0001 [Porphyra umbilicalis]|uniref:Uncharacterized protein n=1 Tax=Porphyra umbilicalis TaxID=2786 RepID=A0A1X6NIT0_PORUM|nr:hypothetical protein BU14_2655s0001 [Porphyra umbilicalis]|eukprot:OSX68515.1 hypothetical protein BU14_2655s0001 [Porphyra umbilicalis]